MHQGKSRHADPFQESAPLVSRAPDAQVRQVSSFSTRTMSRQSNHMSMSSNRDLLEELESELKASSANGRFSRSNFEATSTSVERREMRLREIESLGLDTAPSLSGHSRLSGNSSFSDAKLLSATLHVPTPQLSAALVAGGTSSPRRQKVRKPKAMPVEKKSSSRTFKDLFRNVSGASSKDSFESQSSRDSDLTNGPQSPKSRQKGKNDLF